MRLIDPAHPFFRPAWRRYALVAACFAWAGVEWQFDNRLWAYVFAGIGGFLAWNLILAWRPDDGTAGRDKTGDGGAGGAGDA